MDTIWVFARKKCLVTVLYVVLIVKRKKKNPIFLSAKLHNGFLCSRVDGGGMGIDRKWCAIWSNCLHKKNETFSTPPDDLPCSILVSFLLFSFSLLLIVCAPLKLIFRSFQEKSRAHKHHRSFFFLLASSESKVAREMWKELKSAWRGLTFVLSFAWTKTLQNKFAALLKQANIELEQINIVFLYYVIIMDGFFFFSIPLLHFFLVFLRYMSKLWCVCFGWRRIFGSIIMKKELKHETNSPLGFV